MRKIFFANLALQDLSDIHDFISIHSAESADRVIAEILDEVESVAGMPTLGHARADVRDRRLRFWLVYSYLVAFTFDEQAFNVVRIVHGARNIRRIKWR